MLCLEWLCKDERQGEMWAYYSTNVKNYCLKVIIEALEVSIFRGDFGVSEIFDIYWYPIDKFLHERKQTNC